MKPFHKTAVIVAFLIVLCIGCYWFFIRSNSAKAFSSAHEDTSGRTGMREATDLRHETMSDVDFETSQVKDSDLIQRDIDDQIEEQTAITYTNNRTNHVDVVDKNRLFGGKPIRFVTLVGSDTSTEESLVDIDSPINALMLKWRTISGLENVIITRVNHTISSMKDMPEVDIPSCVWITDIARIKLSDQDVSILKSYLTGGGMLLSSSRSADGEEEFDLFVNRMFPDKKTFKISHDENVISQTPFAFPDGPPSLTGNDGNAHCFGLRNGSRIIAIHYPGDIVSAWNPTNTNINNNIRKIAIEFGINMLYYGHQRD